MNKGIEKENLDYQKYYLKEFFTLMVNVNYRFL